MAPTSMQMDMQEHVAPDSSSVQNEQAAVPGSNIVCVPGWRLLSSNSLVLFVIRIFRC